MMPTYRVTDPFSGKTVKLTGDSPPTEQELEQIFSSIVPSAAPAEQTATAQPELPPKGLSQLAGEGSMLEYQGAMTEPSRAIAGAVAPYAPIAGAVVGGLAAAPANIVAPGVAEVVGGTLGYAGGKQVGTLLKNYGEGKSLPSTLDMTKQAVMEDLPEGGTAALAGPVIGKGVSAAVAGAGKLGRQVLGSLTGTGTGAIEEALKGTPKFRDALRGKISSDEVVENARSALGVLKQQRGAAYQNELSALATNQGSINIDPLKQETKNLLKQYVRTDKLTQAPDWTRSALGGEKSEGVQKIKEIVDNIESWGTKQGDDTIVGLDMLKRQLDDFWSESSNARAFVTTMRNKVKDLLVDNAPSYSNMTKGYQEATKLIKDVESGLMMRKQGMSGRIIADQTLRRLSSSMRDNFQLRRELVEALGTQGGQDIAGEVAGHAMSQVIPRGLTGSGLAVGGGMMATFLKPELLPILIASSPRVSGEFLMLFGKGLKETPGMTEAGVKFLSYLAVNQGR